MSEKIVNRNRKSLRLNGFDYSQPGFYFVTICTYNRECLFADVGAGPRARPKMVLNDSGKMIQRVWQEIVHYYGVDIDEYVVMPNHQENPLKWELDPENPQSEIGRPTGSRLTGHIHEKV